MKNNNNNKAAKTIINIKYRIITGLTIEYPNLLDKLAWFWSQNANMYIILHQNHFLQV